MCSAPFSNIYKFFYYYYIPDRSFDSVRLSTLDFNVQISFESLTSICCYRFFVVYFAVKIFYRDDVF